MTHLLREVGWAAAHYHVAIACTPGAQRVPAAGDRLPDGYATGWAGDVTCRDCLERPVPWRPWRRDASGRPADMGTVKPIGPRPDDAEMARSGP